MTSQIAALDLGSNSFHLVIAENRDGRLQILDKLKETVRLAEGLDEDNHLDPQVIDRALECLSRFGQRLKRIPPENICVVGTNTLRKARNSKKFIRKAEAALGLDIDIVSGQEEARLIYLGVSHALEDNHDKRLVIDIGGGSTELILGRQFKPQRLESLFMGCVNISRQFFPGGRIKKSAMQAAKLRALQELVPVQRPIRKVGWDTVIGASGTLLAVNDVLQANGWSQHSITADGLATLIDALVQFKDTQSLSLEGLSDDRRAVFPGGVAILAAIFEALAIDTMQVSSCALREGLLYDFLGRTTSEDIRANSVRDLAARYQIDTDHANRVTETALMLFGLLAKPWGLGKKRHLPLLRWAAMLHEVGMDVSHRQYHKHGGYLIKNMDMDGFSQSEQDNLALLVRAHRRKYPIAEFAALPDKERIALLYLMVVLRLSVLLHRNRTEQALPKFTAIAGESRLHCIFPSGWFIDHPLTLLDLTQEADYLATVPIKLTVTDSE